MAFIVRVVFLEQGEICEVLRENNRDLSSPASAWLKAMTFSSDESRLPYEVCHLLSPSLVVSIGFQSTDKENHRAFNITCFESVADVGDDGHSLPRLVSKH